MAPNRKRVGPYTVIELLGEGGMGQVYRARLRDQEVAVKVIRASMIENDDIRARFSREIEMLQTIESPHIARILGSDLSKKTAWMSTEFVDGPTLKSLVDDYGPLSEEAWWVLAEGLLKAVEAVHDSDVIHQDIKPANIMMSRSGPKLIDFGISREVGSTRMTMTGMFAGSAGWMAPERAEKDLETTASDLFSAGLVLSFAALGKHPWEAETTQSDVAITLSMLSNSPDIEGLSPRQKALVESLLERDPEARPSATRALARLRGEVVSGRKCVGIQALRRGNAAESLWPNFTPVYTWQTTLAKGLAVAAGSAGLIYILGLFLAARGGVARWENALHLTGWLMGDALALFPSALDFSWGLDQQAQSTALLSLRPTMLSAIILIASFVLARNISRSKPELSVKAATLHGVVYVAPLLGAIATIRYFGAQISPAQVEIEPWGPWDVVFAGFLVATIFALGLALPQRSTQKTAFGWFALASRRMIQVTFIFVGMAAVSLVAYTVLAPVFLSSKGFSGAGPFGAFSADDYASVYLFILAYLPTLVFGWVSLASAGLGGISIQRDNSIVLQALVPEAEEPISFFALWVPGDWVLACFAVLLVILVGLVGGASATRQSGIGPTNLRAAAFLLLIAIGYWGVFQWLARIEPMEAGGPLQGSLLFQPNLTHFVASSLTGALLAGLFAGSMVLASRPAVWRFVTQALPRSIIGFRAFADIEDKSRPRVPRLAGAVITGVLITAFVIPVGVGAGERVYANFMTPERVANDLADSLEIDNPEDLRETFDPGSEESGQWLSAGQLDKARPDSASPRTVVVENGQGFVWQLGELDSTAHVSWGLGAGATKWAIPISATVEKQFRYFRTPLYEAEVKPVILNVGVDSAAANGDAPEIKLNSETLTPGRYLGVPGSYTLQRDGKYFLAPHDSSVTTRDAKVDIVIESDFRLPAGAEALLTQARDQVADSCGGLRSGVCISYSDIDYYMRVLSGRVPSSYYSANVGGYVRGAVQCSTMTNQFVSLSEIVNIADCTQNVRQSTTYYDSNTISEPVYSTRCAYYSYSWYWGYYCSRYEEYQSSTNYRTVRGSALQTVKSESKVPFDIRITATVNEAGELAVSEAEVG